LSLWRPWKGHEPQVLIYPPKVQSAWDQLYRFDTGKDFTPGGYHSILAELNRQIAEYEVELRRWKRELRHRKSAADEFVVRAKSTGTVLEIFAQKGEFVARRDLIAEIEENTPRTAVGWLDDSLVAAVYIGMTAQVRYSFRGQSKSISGTIVDIQAGSDAAQPDKYGMVVTIKATGVGLLKTRKWFRRNAPARIYLQRRPLTWLLDGGTHESP
jgi:hypothetical protein